MVKPVSLQIPDADLEEMQGIFRRHVEGETIPQIAKDLGISVSRTNKMLGLAREAVYNDLMTYGKKEMATIYAKFSFIYDQAFAEWQSTRNPKFLAEMRAALAEQKRMLGLDAAPKAAVSGDESTDDSQLIFVMSDDAYKQKEAALAAEQANAIDIVPNGEIEVE